VITRLQRGGSERDLEHLVRWQLARGIDVTIAAGPESDTRQLGGAPVTIIPALRRAPAIGDLESVRQLRRLLQRLRPRVVHAHQSKAGVVSALAAIGLDLAVMRTITMPSFGPGSGAAGGIFRGIEWVASRRTSLYTTVSEELRRRYLDAGIGVPERFVVVRSPIDLPRFTRLRLTRADPDARLAARRALGIPTTAALVVAIGALEPRKRHGLLIRTLARPLAEGRLRLAIAGDGPLKDALREDARSLGVSGAVHLLGYVADPSPVLAAADALAISSATEGLPQVLIQALAAGVPIVATEVEGLREITDAPIRIAAADGSDLGAALTEVTERTAPRAIAPAALAEWSAEAVDRQWDAAYALLIAADRT
jgi:glycosyltransferase involved in cell wall biosynthesis